MVTRLQGTGSSRGQSEGGRLGPGHPPICTLGVGARGTEAHPGGSAGRWCAAPGPRSAAPPRPCALCPGCRSCTRRRRPAPAGPRHAPAEATSHPPPLPVHPLPSPPHTTFRACSRPRQASLRKVKDLGGGTSWMADTRFRKFTAKSCAERRPSAPEGCSPTPQKSAWPSSPAL